MSEIERIYVVLPAFVTGEDNQEVEQPAGRLIAQACHVTSKLRHEYGMTTAVVPTRKADRVTIPVHHEITTIVLHARDSNELTHVFNLLVFKNYKPVLFYDSNKAAYGSARPATALAVFMKPADTIGILDYLPLWGS